MYWILSVGHIGQHTSTSIMVYDLLDFKTKHRATIYLYLILEDEQKPKQWF